MAVVTCMLNCAHRSKVPLRKWKRKSGEKCYGCTLESVTISRIIDPDGDAYNLLGEKELAHCADYTPIEDVQV